MTILVTGGAGYIGAHVVRALRERGDEVIIVDDLVTGIATRNAEVPLFQMDVAKSSSVDELAQLLSSRGVTGVIHFAARKQVGESVAKPAWYFAENVGGLANVLLAMERARVGRIIFSSSAAVYGDARGFVAETATKAPTSPYGETKLVGEWLIDAAARAQQLDAISLRYFNVAGAGWPELGDQMALNLVPMVFERLHAQESPRIFGDDYDTPDGTCIRDYVHVMDLAEAHIVALDALNSKGGRHRVFNVGTGEGTSVREMIDVILRVSGAPFTAEVVARRPGDPAQVTADVALIAQQLGWQSSRNIVDIVESAWAAHQRD
ncbi:UDP-glucose 4-epimerase [freshwater metagenome]|uniref:UDP-glucose 4-epimerase n=1 Tax=freshwater metagenome TaxID=449393 RepID=A0A094QC85_9ZZZZ